MLTFLRYNSRSFLHKRLFQARTSPLYDQGKIVNFCDFSSVLLSRFPLGVIMACWFAVWLQSHIY
jgi:hypothetical protein